jgi:hypothetical protein
MLNRRNGLPPDGHRTAGAGCVRIGLESEGRLARAGRRMPNLLNRHRAECVPRQGNATPFQLRRVWGGINGVLFHQMLHGVDIQPPSSRHSKSIGHQHVLEPELRSKRLAGHLRHRGAHGSSGFTAPASEAQQNSRQVVLCDDDQPIRLLQVGPDPGRA